MTVTPRPPALPSPFEFCLVCGLLLASEQECKSACRFQEPNLTENFGRAAAVSRMVSDELVAVLHHGSKDIGLTSKCPPSGNILSVRGRP